MTSHSDPEARLRALWTEQGVPQARQNEVIAAIIATPVPTHLFRPAEDLTPEGVQLVIPGTEKRLPATVKQGELW